MSGAPDTGLKLGGEEHIERYDPIALAALSSQSLRDALHKQLTCTEKITLVPRGSQRELRFAWLLAHEPGLHDVARELRLSARTLQRRLTGEKATFQRLMEEARRELARHYLLHSSLELNETAYLLGCEDANSFFRAFHQWEGTSPGDWRSTHRVSATQTISPQSAAVTRENYSRAI